jgi:hypothetical protein
MGAAAWPLGQEGIWGSIGVVSQTAYEATD